ncbi:unnamed protein product, partial [Rotaria sp. Silwood2]
VVLINQTNPPQKTQKKPRKLTGLKPITLREIDSTKDKIYEGYVLSVAIIEQTLSFEPSILLLIEDENLDIERMFIYNFSPEIGQQLIEEVFTIGTKMEILNPYLRIGIHDLKPGIRVDDFTSIIMQDKSEKVTKMCRCCGEENASKKCGKCNRALYCSKDCQIIDWRHYGHKLICNNAAEQQTVNSQYNK